VKTCALLLLSAVLCAACGKPASDASPKKVSSYATQPWSLVGAYERAHRERNVEHALALVNLGSVDIRTRDTLIRNLKEDFQKELVVARIVPLAGDEKLEYLINGRRVVPNLQVDKRLQIEFRAPGSGGKPETSTTEYYVGTLNGREMIASSMFVP
jgi:hypothetical protein